MRTRKAFASCWMERDGDVTVGYLYEGGYDMFPVIAPRWTVTSAADAYGFGPGTDALGDVKELQHLERRQERGVGFGGQQGGCGGQRAVGRFGDRWSTEHDSHRAIADVLGKIRRWPVTVSYFDESAKDAPPDRVSGAGRVSQRQMAPGLAEQADREVAE